jgi:hypothetical protein
MTKVFRQYAIDHDLFRPLRQKVAELPAADMLRGAPALWVGCGFVKVTRDVEVHPRYTGTERVRGDFETTLERIRRLKNEFGIGSALVVLTAWERAGRRYSGA